MAKRLNGNTATLWESAFSGVIIKVLDDESLLVQDFYPKNGETAYSEPVESEICYDKEGDLFIEHNGNIYYLSDFMRDNI